MDEGLAWEWLVQLLLALSYCHSKKVLHRDVKTQNVMLSKGKVLLGDFGLAKQLQRTLEMARTPIGTPFY
ncbi:NimA-related protein kinase 8, partial [Haematococcus lacustris]